MQIRAVIRTSILLNILSDDDIGCVTPILPQAAGLMSRISAAAANTAIGAIKMPEIRNIESSWMVVCDF